MKIAKAVLLVMGMVGMGAEALAQDARAGRPRISLPAAESCAQEPQNKPTAVDFSGDPLPSDALARLGTLRFRHMSFITSIALAPDGKVLASGGNDRVVRLWDVSTGKELRKLEGHFGAVAAVAFSPDGKTLASASNGSGEHGPFRLWDVATGKEVRRLEVTDEDVLHFRTVAFSPNGEQVAAGGWYQVPLRRWSVATGKELWRTEAKHGSHCVAYSPDGQTLLSAEAYGDRALRWWETASGKERRGTTTPGKEFLTTAFSPDGKLLAARARTTNGGIPSVIVWDALTGGIHPHMKELRGASAFAFAPDSQTLAIQRDEETSLWAVGTGKQLRSFPGESQSLMFTPDGQHLAATRRQMVYFRDVAKGKTVHPWAGHSSEVATLTFAPDGRTLVSSGGAYRDRDRWLWQLPKGNAIRPLPRAPSTAFSWAVSPDGQTLAWNALPDGDGLIHLCEGATGKEVRQFRVPSPLPVQLIAISPNNRLLAWWSLGDLALHLTDLESGKEIRKIADPGIWITFSPDSKSVLSSNSNRLLCLWDVATGQDRILGPHTGWKAAFSADGQELAAQDAEGNICLWDVSSGKSRKLGSHASGVSALAFSADGKTVASGGSNGTLVVWDRTTGKVLRQFGGHTARVTVLAFAPDGRTLASGSADTTVLLWDLLQKTSP